MPEDFDYNYVEERYGGMAQMHELYLRQYILKERQDLIDDEDRECLELKFISAKWLWLVALPIIEGKLRKIMQEVAL